MNVYEKKFAYFNEIVVFSHVREDRMNRWMKGRLFGVAALFLVGLIGHAATPIFSIIPTTPTTISLPVNGAVTVQYRVTNQTAITRTLTIKPIQGVSQTTVGAGVCASPFTLAPNQSCLLTLIVNGSQMPKIINGGPVVCKTKCANNNSPDSFLCAQPAPANQLNITAGPFEAPVLTVKPPELSLVFADPTFTVLNVTNRSLFVTATFIRAMLPSSLSTVIQNSSDCLTLAPGGTCHLLFSAGATPATPLTLVPVQGSNTQPATFLMDVVDTKISASPRLLKFVVGQIGTVTVTNQGPFTALNVTATVPTGSPIVATPSASCASIAVGGTCTIDFTSTQNTTLTSIKIKGTNTSSVFIDAQAVKYAYITNLLGNSITQCTINSTNNELESCGPAGGSGFANPGAIVFNQTGNRAYIYNTDRNTPVSLCYVNSVGNLTSCEYTGFIGANSNPPNNPNLAFALNPTETFAYGATTQFVIDKSQINPTNGLLSSGVNSGAYNINTPQGLAINPDGTKAYISLNGLGITLCTINNDGSFSSCAPIGGAFNPYGLSFNAKGTVLYIAQAGSGPVMKCDVDQTTGLLTCTSISYPVDSNEPVSVSLLTQDTFAYVANFSSNTVDLCSVQAGTNLLISCHATGAELIGPTMVAFD